MTFAFAWSLSPKPQYCKDPRQGGEGRGGGGGAHHPNFLKLRDLSTDRLRRQRSKVCSLRRALLRLAPNSTSALPYPHGPSPPSPPAAILASWTRYPCRSTARMAPVRARQSSLARRWCSRCWDGVVRPEANNVRGFGEEGEVPAVVVVFVVVLSLERCGDQQHRRRACPEFVADRAKVLMLEVILFYKLNFTSKEHFHAG